MNVQLDWKAGDENGRWETVATIGNRARRVTRWRVWVVLALTAPVLFAAGSISTILLLRRYDAALGQVTRRIQDAIDSEARTIARQAEPGFPNADIHTMPAIVREVETMGDIAWVQVVTGWEPVRQVRFYRQTEFGWQDAAPDARFWREPVAFSYGGISVRGHQRDLPYIGALVEHIARVYYVQLDILSPGWTSCPLEIDFAIEPTPGASPSLMGSKLTLPSPWLSGIPFYEAWDEGRLDELARWAAYAAETQALLGWCE